MSVEIIYETHSLTTENTAGYATGWLPGELSEEGRRLAAELCARRRHEGLAAVFVSDLRCAAQTAEIAIGTSGIPIYRDARLRECNYGDLNGMPVQRLAAERARHIDTPFRGGQSYREVVDAMREFLCELAANRNGRRVLVIGHSANKWALDCLPCGRRREDLVSEPFGWREGWRYVLPAGWDGSCSPRGGS